MLLRSLLRRAAYEGLRPVPRDNWAAPLFEMPKAKKAPTVSSGIRKSTRTRTAPQRLSPDSDLPCVQPSAGRARSSSLSCRLCCAPSVLLSWRYTSRPRAPLRRSDIQAMIHEAATATAAKSDVPFAPEAVTMLERVRTPHALPARGLS